MVFFVVFSTLSGSPTSRNILRAGSCPVESIPSQAYGAGEGAMQVDSELNFGDTSPAGFTVDTTNGAVYFIGAPGPPTPSELENAMFAARTDLRLALRACDWAVLSDAPLTTAQKSAWLTYRANLRAMATDPFFGKPNSAVGYPTPPTTTEF